MTRRLLVLDQYDTGWLERAAAATAPGDEWRLLLLGLSDGLFRRQFGESLSRLTRWQMVNQADLADDAHLRVNEFVLNFVDRLPDVDLGGATLAQLLDAPEGSRWWYLETSEKSPFRGPLVENLYRLAMVRLAVERGGCDSLWLEVSETPLREAITSGAASLPPVEAGAAPPSPRRRIPLLEYWRNAARAFLGWVFIRFFMAIAGWPVLRPDERVERFFYSVYPYWWLKPFESGAADRFFQAAPGKTPSRFVVWLSQPLTLWRNRRAAAGVARANGLIALQQFVTLRDALSLLGPDMFVRQRQSEQRTGAHLRAAFCGFDVAPLVCADIVRSLCSYEFFLDRMTFAALNRLASCYGGAVFIYRVEFQPWENAILFGIRRRMKTIGFRHSPLGRNYLPMRFAKGELGRSLSGQSLQRSRPLPDVMLVSGPVGADRLAADGFPRDRISICGPQRHRDLLSRLKQRSPRAQLRERLDLPAGAAVIFVAVAIVEADAEALFAALAGAGGPPGDFRLIVKTHPARPLGGAAMQPAFAVVGQDRASVMPPGGDMYDYIAASDAMICVGSTIAFEAMAMGVMPVVFENPATFAATSLAEFDSALFIARDADSLRAALADVMANGERTRAKRRMWPETLTRVFNDLETPLAEQLETALAQLEQAAF